MNQRIRRVYRVLCALCVLLLIATPAFAARTIHVDCTRPDDTGDGLTWETAKRTVQAGLSTALSGDQVWVAKGTYVERVTLTVGVGLYGGFSGTETQLDQRDWVTNVAVLDGSKGAVSLPLLGQRRRPGSTVSR